MKPNFITIGGWVEQCPLCGGPLFQENVKEQVFKTCRSNPNHYFFVDSRIVYNQKGGEMYKLGNILIILTALAILVIAFRRAPGGWLLVPIGILAAWLVPIVIARVKKNRDYKQKGPSAEEK